MEIGSIIARHARYRPDHTAVVFEEQRLTYREFYARVNRLANVFLTMGMQKGDKIATILPNCLEVLDIYWAAAQMGLVVVPLSVMMRAPALVSLLRDSDTVLVFATDDILKQLEPHHAELPAILPDRYVTLSIPGEHGVVYDSLVAAASDQPPPEVSITSDDLYNIIYSSGTTGMPKGIMHTHFVRATYCLTFATAFRITPESIALHTGSLAFNGAFLTLMPIFFQGGTYILHPSFDVKRLVQTIDEEKVTHIVMVPSQIVAMLASNRFDPNKMRSLEMLLTVGAPLHLEHKQALIHRLPGVFYELYGLTEGFSTILDKTMVASKPGSVGAPPPMYQMKIVDADGNTLPPGQIGEIVGRGPKIMAGYYKRPDLTAQAIQAGWLYTGDLGYTDEDGYLYLVDRKKELIISGGINVYPRDIEEILVQHPAVLEAAVFGVPDDKWGETPVAALILREGYTVHPEEIQHWTNERVHASYQRLSAVVLCSAFPRSVSGKTLKRVLCDDYLTAVAAANK